MADALSVVFAVALVVPLVAEVTPATRGALETVMWFIWAAFVSDCLTLVYLAPDWVHMVRTHVLDGLFGITERVCRGSRADGGCSRRSRCTLMSADHGVGKSGSFALLGGEAHAARMSVSGFHDELQGVTDIQGKVTFELIAVG